MKYGLVHQQEKLDVVHNSVGVVILARLSSRRLPGKALMLINDKEAIGHVLERVSMVFDKAKIIIATSTESSDNPLVTYAKAKNIQVYRGSLENVSTRFYEAAKILNVRFACRINGDNIFLAIDILQKMKGLAETNKYLFISNVMNRTFPKGMSVEIVDCDFYMKCLDSISSNKFHSEHVMTFFYNNINKDSCYFLYYHGLELGSTVDLALDTWDDYMRSCWMAPKLEGKSFKLQETLEIFYLYEEHIKR